MRKLPSIFLATLFFVLGPARNSFAQQRPPMELGSQTGDIEYDFQTGTFLATNGVMVRYGEAVLVAERAMVNQETGEALAEGRVRVQQGEQIWAGEHIRYNFHTRQMEAEHFRTGRSPVFAAGEALTGDLTNEVYTASNAYITTDDVAEPATKVRAKSIKIIPGKSFEARNAVLYVGNLPVFWLPYYKRSLAMRANNFNLTPGYRSRYGPFLLTSYNWFWSDAIDGAFHLDYRVKRGLGGGPDLNLHLDRWGEAEFKYYYLYDEDPSATAAGYSIPADRQRFHFGYDATPFTNLTVKSMVRYQSDERILHDFFEGEYRQNPQPNTFVEVNKVWSNFSLDLYVEPRVNDFFEAVERLPEVRLTGFRQQLGATPLYYDSESSAGYYRRRFADTNGPPLGLDYSASRADTYHQLTLPQTFFGWLNVTPRAGGRFTYYSEATGAGGTNNEVYRSVFNTGAEVSFKAARLWPGATNRFLAVDGLRHIFQPSVNYVYVPRPEDRPPDLPQFDYELPSLRLLPIEFTDYNSIDSIDSQNVLRFGLRNKLQTKRAGQVQDLVYWDLYTDWRLNPRPDQTTFADLYSDLVFRPQTWLTLESQTRYDLDRDRFQLAFHSLRFQPTERWSWSLGHWYLHDDFRASPTALGQGNSLFSSILFFRLNENWAARTAHYFEARDGRMEEQSYTIYRDLRSWTAGFTLRLRDQRESSDDITFAFTFSLKAAPKYRVGDDAVRSSQLLGY